VQKELLSIMNSIHDEQHRYVWL